MIKRVLALFLAAFAGNALAANINIGPNGCTLSDAIDSANMNVAIGNCAPGSGSDFIIAPDNWVVTLNSDLPTIVTDMTFRSATAAGLFYINGDDRRRVLKITGNNTQVTLKRVHISGGKTQNSNGAGIRIENATVRLEDSLVVANESANAPGAGISVSNGDLTVDRSYVSVNTGQGIYATDSSVHVVDSTISHNSAAAMSAYGSNLLIEGSLIDEGVAGIGGAQTVAEFVNTTFTDSIAGSYSTAQAFGFSGTSSVTLNHVTSRLYFRLDDSFLSASNSLLFTCQIFSTNLLLNTGNLYHSTGTSNSDNCLGKSPFDYSLLPLADNGGPTRTHAIYDSNSAAINGGDPAYCTAVDQRGEARGANCDVGAYEATGFADVAVTARIDPVAPYVSGQHIILYAEIRNRGPGPATNVHFDMDADHAFISSVNSANCSAIPCVITRIEPSQTVVVPIEMTLGNYFNSPFSVDLSAHSTANSTYRDANENDPSGNNFFSLSHAINQGADLALTMNLQTAGPYFIGQTVRYAARINNAGPQTASGTQLQFTPDHLNNIAFSGCASVSGLTCNVSNIASGSSRDVTIDATIADTQFNAIGGVSATQVDIHPDDNVDGNNNGGGVSESDIAVDVRILDDGPYYSLEYLRFQISILTGNQPASNIRVDYDLPGSEYITVSSCPQIPCIIPQLAANSQIDLIVQIYAPLFVPGVIETINLHVEAWPGQTDPHGADNEATVSRPLLPEADVFAQLSLISTPPFYAGQEIQYALRVANNSVNSANAVHIGVNPQNLSLLSTFGDQCPNVPCTISRLGLADEENITLIYRIDGAGAFNLTASASANEFDSNTSNNTDSTNNGGTADATPVFDRIFADGFE